MGESVGAAQFITDHLHYLYMFVQVELGEYMWSQIKIINLQNFLIKLTIISQQSTHDFLDAVIGLIMTNSKIWLKSSY